MNVLCLVSEPAQFTVLQRTLEPSGARCVRHTDEYLLLRRLNRLDCQVLIVDVGRDPGLEERLIAWMECHPEDRPPIVWRCVEYDPVFAVRALRAGAADVFDRATDPDEVHARIQAAARRTPQDMRPRKLQVAGFELDLQLQSIFDEGRPIEVSPREFALAWLLFSHPGVNLSRDVIGIAVWGRDSEISGRTMEQHIHRLRKKLGLVRQRGVAIRAIYGQGYRLRVDQTRRPAESSRGSETLSLPRLPPLDQQQLSLVGADEEDRVF